jgi:hypothetical protein
MSILFIPMNVKAVDGYISVDYNTQNDEMESELYLYKQINKFEVGGKFKTHTLPIISETINFPEGRPSFQVYSFILKYNINKQITINFNSDIKQYFAQAWYNTYYDENYTKIGIKYEFGD